jgi:hypothetical protein
MICGMKNVLRPLVVGSGGNANGNDVFSRFKISFAVQKNWLLT